MTPRGELVDFDPRLSHPFSCILSGASCAGKTTLLKSILTDETKATNTCFDNIVFIYSCWQKAYDDLLSIRNDIHFIKGIPETLDDDSLIPPHKTNLIIFDDVMKEGSNSPELERTFTAYVHHKNLSCFYLVQNLFLPGTVF